MAAKKKPHGTKTGGRRSKWEYEIGKLLEEKGIKFEYESKRYRFLTQHNYVPDYILENGIVLEVKGWFTAEDRAKLLKVREFYPDLDVRLVFKKDNKINRYAKMRYSDWCERHGFKYAIGTIPDEWLVEPKKKVPNTLKLKEISDVIKKFKASDGGD